MSPPISDGRFLLPEREKKTIGGDARTMNPFLDEDKNDRPSMHSHDAPLLERGRGLVRSERGCSAINEERLARASEEG